MKVKTVSTLPDVLLLEEPPMGSVVLYRPMRGGIAGFRRQTDVDGSRWTYFGTARTYSWAEVQDFVNFGQLIAVLSP